MLGTLSRLLSIAETESAALPDLIIKAEQMLISMYSGVHKRKKSGLGEQFWQYRDYSLFDRAQDVDWRQSAKGDRLYVRQTENQTPQKIYFWCQSDENMDYHSHKRLLSKRERSLVTLVALSMLCHRSGEQCSHLSGKSKHLRPEQLAQLLLEQNQDEVLPPPPSHVARKSIGIFAGDFLSDIDSLKSSFAMHRPRFSRLFIIQVLDPAELDFPFQGHTVFKGVRENTISEKVDNARSVRAEYKHRINTHNHKLKTLCAEYDIELHTHRTDHPSEDLLGALWGSMQI